MYAYDPRLKSKEELEATEFLSQKTIDEIIKSLTPDSKGNLTNQSWLIYGSRGMGKSHILILTYHKIKDDKKLSKGWLPILCPEELYTVNSLYRLFKEFGTLILNEVEKQYDIKVVRKFQEKINEINKIRILGNAKERKEKERELTNQYLEIFIEINKTLKRKFIFFIENLQEVFSKQINEDEQKYLRDIFYQYPELMIWLASAVQIPGKLMDYGMPFYHFFRIRKLEGMSSEEIINMLFKFCKLDENYKLQRNLKEMESDISVFGLLSGGNPRLIVLLYKFLENGEVKGVKEMMKVFISDLTPYFQRETETLTNQQKLVIDSLSLNVFPLLTIKDITYDSNLPEPIVSSQVNKLRTTHWLRTEKVATLKSELFILSEYIYRVWYQMRMGGIYQENARWTAEFLSFIFPIRKIREKVGELEKLISETNIKDNIQERDFLRSELGTYKMALAWQEDKEVKRYLKILKKTEEKPDVEMEKVLELIKSKKYEEAILTLDKLIDKNPMYIYYDIRGYTQAVFLGQYDKAITDYTKAIELNPEYASAYYNRGTTYSSLKEYDKAITDFTKAIELNPEYALAYYNRGTTYSSLKEYDKAITDFTKAIELNPEDALDYNNRGTTYSSLKEYDKAITDFTKAIELNPEYARAYNNRGNSYSSLREYDKAITDYTKAIELNPEYALAYYNRGTTYSSLREYDKAITDFTKAIELNPEDALAYNNRGNTYSSLKEYDKATKDFTKAIELNPEYAIAYNNRGISYSDLKEYDKAIKDYTKAIELNPEDARAYNNRGNTYSSLKEYDKAITDFTKAIELNPELILTYKNRISSNIKLDNFEKCIDDFMIIIQKTGFIIYMQDASNLISKYIDNKYKVTSSIQNLFEKDKSDDKILKHIIILLHFKQNDIIKTYFSENGYKILKNSKSSYPFIISFTALFNLIELVKSGNPRYKELAKLWINITKNIEFYDDEEKENIFNKSLMLIYTLAVKDEKSVELAKDVLHIINSEYHSIAESHFYIPKALVNAKTPEVEKLMKETIFKNTLEKIKLQRELLEK
ncbi:MAG: tetratricopeptide repeat protein [Candidatus Cloacimonetes bacterium]|nr:tetratricopeptide repeat protein [Candidatus Cloacimonadota bacterium]